MTDCRRYEGVTAEKMEQVKQGLERSGVRLPDGPSGIIEAMGVRVSVNFVAAEQTLEVCIIEKPPFIPDTLIWAQIESPLKA
ncbi:MAG TPA: hypothetical protein VG860_02620 [Terriglobia bacterium]|jgi:hypothetical protein|nr:hypothetical protein [Terriglobia bacterium]